MPVYIERSTYKEFGNCVKIYNEISELYVTTDFGPRVIHYSLLGGSNIMFNNHQHVNIKRGEDFDRTFYSGAYWDVYGGNRMWVCPEIMPDTFYPDHDQVDYEIILNGAIFMCKPQIHNDVQLSMRVTLEESSSRVHLVYTAKNIGNTPKVMSAWSISAVDAGGFEIIPQSTEKKGVIPNRLISLWDYSDMSDKRLHWLKNYIVLQQIPDIDRPTKVGINNTDGWACYLNKGICFVCRYNHDPDGNYADLGVSYESYANQYYLEMESMAPLKRIETDQSSVHEETWEVFPVESVPDYACESKLSAFVDEFIRHKD